MEQKKLTKCVLIGGHVGEHLTKVGRADGEHKPMRFDELPLCRQRHVHKIAIHERFMKPRREVCVEIIPTQRK